MLVLPSANALLFRFVILPLFLFTSNLQFDRRTFSALGTRRRCTTSHTSMFICDINSVLADSRHSTPSLPNSAAVMLGWSGSTKTFLPVFLLTNLITCVPLNLFSVLLSSLQADLSSLPVVLATVSPPPSLCGTATSPIMIS